MEENVTAKKDDDSRLELYDWVQCIVTALIAGILIFVFIGRVITVDGSSMFPTLVDTDKIITTNLFYDPQPGDVIVFQTDTFGPRPLVKRVIATEGQTVDIDFDSGVVYVDGVARDEPFVNEPTHQPEDFDGPVTVPEGCLFVMGDNRNASEDSRSHRVGFVDENCIIGKVIFVLFPGETEVTKRDFGRIGSPYNG